MIRDPLGRCYAKEAYTGIMPGNYMMKALVPGRRATDLAQARTARSPQCALKAMASVVVHELNNVLTAAIGNLSLLDEAGSFASEDATQFVSEALAATRRGVSLSEELEAFASQLRLRPEIADANDLVHQAVTQLPGRLDYAELRMRLAPVRLPVHIDPIRFRHAVTSTAVGAIRAMSERVDCLAVETAAVSGANGGRSVRIAIVCDGERVEEDTVADALANFHSGARAGIWGLASVSGFLAQSGGRLRAHVESSSRLRLTIELLA